MQTLWESPTASAYDVRLATWEVAYEEACELLDANPEVTTIDIYEYRPAQIGDLSTHVLTDETWDAMSELLQYWDDMCTDDGGPILSSAYRNFADPRPPAWTKLRDAIGQVLTEHLDLSEAAWQPTLRWRRVMRFANNRSKFRFEEHQS